MLEGQSVAGEILQAAERLDVDAIALASHGRTGIGRVLLGSVAEEVARKSTRPLLIVHAKTGDGRAIEAEPRRSHEVVMKAVVESAGKVASRVRLGRHDLLFDQPAPVPGGEDRGPSPLDVLAASVAACERAVPRTGRCSTPRRWS